MPHDKTEAPNLILSESVSALQLYLLEVLADRMRGDVKAEALAAKEGTGEDPESMAVLVSGMKGC